MGEIDLNKIQFRREIFLALVVTGLACVAGFSNIFFAPNDLYPAATDYMGHAAKVQYIYECLRNEEIPSWFPGWYCGSTVNQYYPPLPFYLMAPIYALTQNVMITFKIYCFLMLLIGGMGIWYLCRTMIGKWCGLAAILLYCLQPFLLTSLYIAGVVAQGPIYAITPWLLMSVFNYTQKQNKAGFMLITIFTSIMILSHAMHAFMVLLVIMIVLGIRVIFKQVNPITYIYSLIAVIFSGLLTAFWSLVGVTRLENPTIPYILPGVTENVTATLNWYDPRNMGSLLFHFSFPVTAMIILSILVYVLRVLKKRTTSPERLVIPVCIGISIFSIIISFGKQIPGFEFIPMSESLVPGRILSLTAATGAVAGAYLFHLSIRTIRSLRAIKAAMITLILILTTGVIIYHMNPYQYQYPLDSYDRFTARFNTADTTGTPYEKGRYCVYRGFSSNEANIPLLYDLNLTDGWNIEGTPHNRFIWNNASCLDTDTNDFFAKNLAFWNVRYLSLPEKYSGMATPLIDNLGFTMKYDDTFYVSSQESSYFLIDHRNALICGAGSPGLAMEFPYLIYEQRDDITDYSMEELEKFRLIYLCEPKVRTEQEKEKIEATVQELINSGVTVLIEPAPGGGYALFNVTVADVVLEDVPFIQKQPGSKIASEVDNISIDEGMKYGRAMFGLEDVYYKLIQNGGKLENDIIGTKQAGNGEVIFIGKHLSQYLKAVYARNWGVPNDINGYPECSGSVKALFEDIFSTYGVNKDFWPDPFPVKKADWNYKGVDFEYSSPTAKEMTVSVTYTPRWKASLDGKPIPVGQKENLISLELPAGDHEVKLVYGLTKYGIAGYIISLLGLLFFVLFLGFYDIIIYRFRQISTKTGKFLQLGYDDSEQQNIN